jgi:regulator of protease activity HflC (stomatin/prohibitin superfamily)
MKLSKQAKHLIDNLPIPKIDHDFRFHALSLLVLLVFFLGGVVLQLFFTPQAPVLTLIYAGAGVLVIAGMITFLPLWNIMIKTLAAVWLLGIALLGGSYWPLFSVVTLGFFLAPCFQLAQQWEKAIVLRFGRFRRNKGPGLFLMLPVIERIAEFVDTRIRSTDFKAETTLTRDTVPVNVDAIAFWMIWDPKKAILELETFLDAVILSAQTALRDAIGKHELATLLSERDRLGKEIQAILESKTSAWGITILSIEIRDIIIPKELEDAMSKRAQAERERQSRVILGTAEVEIAEKFEKAAERYKNNPTALHLRAMNMLYEGLKKNGSIVLVPSNALETMSLGTVLGTTALEKVEKMNTQDKEAPDGQD